MAEVKSLKFPNKSHRKKVNLPTDSARLAEFVGIMMGDGGINNEWQATITMNAVSDKDYANYIHDLCLDLFDIVPAIRQRKTRQALVISLSSTTIVDFLVSRGLCRGDKLAQGLSIPKWILADQAYKLACIRGLVDTDGCLYIHKHKVGGKSYENIGLCFTSYSPKLIKQVTAIFEEFGVIPHSSTSGRNIYLYKEEAVAKYLEVFGTSNERIRSVYQEWRGG